MDSFQQFGLFPANKISLLSDATTFDLEKQYPSCSNQGDQVYHVIYNPEAYRTFSILNTRLSF
jgi:hypothetical protein